ncbi:MAG: hypothetical protein EBY76_10175 [Betaproteobacteria bacterium]|nr:hypothetical protein [Betaproteobacteria bacterium]
MVIHSWLDSSQQKPLVNFHSARVVSFQSAPTPAGTPAPIIERLNKEIARASQTPEYKAKLKALWIDPMSATPAEFDAFIRAESERWRKVVQAAGIQPE